MPESTQHKLDRVRPPRVQITYDVETGGAIQKKDLPLVVGILADLSGKPENPLPHLKERKFVEIDRDNFNNVMASIAPRVVVSAENKLVKDGDRLNVALTFQNIDDFNPLNVVKQVEALRKLYEARQHLSDLLAKLDGNDYLDSLLRQAAQNPEELKQITSGSAEGGEANG